MAKLKWMFLLAFLASGLVLGGCSSENDIIDNIDNNDNNDNTDKKPDIDFSKLTWTKRTISSQIEAGSNTNISTRSSADIGHGGNPSSKLPDGIKYYINVYNSNTTDEEFKIDPADYLELTFENDAIIYYTAIHYDNSGNPFVLISNKELPKEPNLEEDKFIWFEVGETQKEVPGERLFYFTTENLAGKDRPIIKLPRTKKEEDLYYDGNSYVEYGDKLFATEGHYFVKNSENNEEIDLYYLESETNYPTLADKNKIKMRRLTGIITIYTMVVDDYDSNGDPKNIDGIDGGTSTAEAIRLTNNALQTALKKVKESPEEFFSTTDLNANDNELRKFLSSNKFDGNYSVDDYFVRKKVLENYPVVYNFIEAKVEYNNDEEPLYLCNLSFPTFMNEKSSYQWGSENSGQFIYGVSSSCDNYPFLPIGSKLVLKPRNALVIFMGMSKPDTDEVTYNPPSHLLQVRIAPSSDVELPPNKSHNLYVVFTIKDMVQMLVKAQMNDAVGTPSPTTRSALEEPVLELPSNRLIFK